MKSPFQSGVICTILVFETPLHTNGLTAAKSRICFARICIEIGASSDFVEEFDLQCGNGNWTTVFA
jgi:hypothetical protein